MKLTTASDEDLVQRIAVGDLSALSALYERHRGPLFGYLCLFTRDHGLIEELVQDTILAAWTGADRFAGRSSVRSWLFAIARRRAADVLRRKSLPVVGEEELGTLPDPDPGPEGWALNQATQAQLATAVARVSAVHREVLVLIFVHELSYPESAEVLGVPVGTVKSRLSNAKRALRAILVSEKP